MRRSRRTPPLPTGRDRHAWKVWLAGAAITSAAAALRFAGLNWDSTAALSDGPGSGFHAPATTHPDERAIFNSVSQLSASNWNPHFFAYGSLPLYLIKLASVAAQVFAGPAWGDYGHIALVGRFVSALFGSATVFFTFLLGWRALGPAVGLLSSLFLGATVLHIQLSHFATTDIHVGLFAVLALWAGFELVRRGGIAASLLLGAAAGLATACKFSGVTLAGVVLAAHALRAIESRRLAGLARTVDERRLAQAEWPAEWSANLGLSLVAGVVAFAVGQPYALLAWRECWGVILGERSMVTGADMRPYVQQYIHTAPYLYPAGQMVRWCFGPALGSLVLVTFLYAAQAGLRGLVSLVRAAAARPASPPRGQRPRPRPASRPWPDVNGPGGYAAILLLSFLLPNFLVVGAFQVKFPRYLIALYPAWCLLCGLVLVRCWRLLPRLRPLTAAVAAAVCAGTIGWAAAFMRIYAEPHPYVTATAWAVRTLPPGTRIVTEHWNEEVPMHGGMGRFRMGDGRKLPVYDLPDDERKASRLAAVLAEGEYVCLASSTLWATLIRLDRADPRWPANAYPATAAMYRLLFSGRLGFAVDRVVAKYPRLLSYEFNDDAVDVSDPSYGYRCDQSLSFYDHPKVIFFRNAEALPQDELTRRILAEAARARAPGRERVRT